MDKITELANKYDALVMVDECHSAGVVGKTGRGVTELYNIRGQVDIITGTLGKAFGGAIGGFTTGRKEIIELLRQRSRPYLFSNSVPPAVVAPASKSSGCSRSRTNCTTGSWRTWNISATRCSPPGSTSNPRNRPSAP